MKISPRSCRLKIAYEVATPERSATSAPLARDAIAPDGSVDRIELWGRRIGRGLSLAGFIALAIYLYLTYFAK